MNNFLIIKDESVDILRYIYRKISLLRLFFVAKRVLANLEPPSTSKSKERFIFQYWHSDSIPEIVSDCFRSTSIHGMETVYLDKNTVLNWIEIPEKILRNLNSGKILHAHFADYVRVKLLATHGGAWLDATVFSIKSMESYFLDNKLFFFKSAPSILGIQSDIRASVWALSSPRNSRTMNFLSNALELILIKGHFYHYFQFHFLWSLGTKLDFEINREFSEANWLNNIDPHSLQILVDGEINISKDIIAREINRSPVQKLSHYGFPYEKFRNILIDQNPIFEEIDK